MPLLTRSALARHIRDGQPLAGVQLRTPTAHVERRAASDEEVAAVRTALGEDAASGRLVPFVISTSGRKPDGLDLKMSGAVMSRYAKNPVVLWNHSYWRSRVADSVVTIEGETMRAIAAFLGRELSEALDDGLSYALGELAARRGHAASIGFSILNATPAPDDVRKQIPWALDVHSWELDEWSLVTVPMDEDAYGHAREIGIDVEPIARALARLLDGLEAEGVERATLERVWAAAANPARSRVFAPDCSDRAHDHRSIKIKGTLTSLL